MDVSRTRCAFSEDKQSIASKILSQTNDLEAFASELERQALRRIEGGSLSDKEIERLGQTFLKLGQRMLELKQAFGLEDQDLNLNLGPLGDLM
jgi:hypothetical protein